jgi:DNA polymerase III subunit delta
MPPADPTSSRPVAVVCGADEFTVKKRARQLYGEWCAAVGGADHEIIDASVANTGEALRVLKQLREALQTLPFFGTAKVVWLQNCNFLGDERTAGAQAVTTPLADLAQELAAFPWENVRLLISAGKIDKRRVFYKTLEKIGAVELHDGWSFDDRDWVGRAEQWALDELRVANKRITDEALAALVAAVGPNIRQLSNEVEKLRLFVGDRPTVEASDVDAIVTRHKQARAFALADALGDRQLPRLLRALDDELWEVKTDTQRSAIGLLYGLITKVRVLIFLKEMLRLGWLKPTADYNRFKAQLQRVPAAGLPADKRLNPLAMNPYVLFKALPQTGNYSLGELVQAMEALLDCNRRLILSSFDEGLVLQQTLVGLLRHNTPPPVAA